MPEPEKTQVKVSDLKETFGIDIETFEINPDAKYLVRAIGATPDRCVDVADWLKSKGVDAIVVPSELHFYKIEP